MFRPRAEGPVSQCMQGRRVVAVKRYLGKSFPNPSSVSMFEQNTASFIASADATSSASMVDMALASIVR